MLHKLRGVRSCRFEMFDHGEHVDNVFLAKRWPVPRLEHVLSQLDLSVEKKTVLFDPRELPVCDMLLKSGISYAVGIRWVSQLDVV